MRARITWVLLLSPVLLVVSEAQAPPQASEPVSEFNVDPDQSTGSPAAPTPFTTSSQSLAFSSELERSNYLNGGVRLSSTYDDNALNTSTDQVSNFSYSVLPYIGLKQDISRLQLRFDYSGGFTINQRLSVRNQGTQTADADLRYRLAPHVDLRLLDNFFMTSGFLNQLSEGIAPGTPDGPNLTLITPLANEKSNNVTGEFSYQFSPGSVVGFGGTYYFLNFSDASGGAQLQNTRMLRGMAFYNHRISHRNWLGLNYSAESLTFSPSSDNTFVHSIQGTLTVLSSHKMTLTAFGGVQFSNTQTEFLFIPISYNQITPTEGANFAWNGLRTSATSTFSHKVSDGGGVLAAVQSTMAQGSVRRQLFRRTGIACNFTYSSNNPLTPN